jgi:hypothetical protein
MEREINNLLGCSNEILSEVYTPDEVNTINNLRVYMANIDTLPDSLLGDSPGIKFVPFLSNNLGA